MTQTSSQDFPCSLHLRVPFPTPRLATIALKAIQVDPELSSLVQRKLSVAQDDGSSPVAVVDQEDGSGHVLLIDYRATTNRMLRVAVNSFMDSLKLVLEVMEKLDSDVLSTQGQQDAPS